MHYYVLRFSEATSDIELVKGGKLEYEEIICEGSVLSLEELQDLVRQGHIIHKTTIPAEAGIETIKQPDELTAYDSRFTIKRAKYRG